MLWGELERRRKGREGGKRGCLISIALKGRTFTSIEGIPGEERGGGGEDLLRKSQSRKRAIIKPGENVLGGGGW